MTLRGERYEILRVIASGGMATVHLGRALGAGGFERLVAVKVMHPHLAGEPEFLAMFLDEARLAARIHHPNVVSTLDVHQDELGAFLVMDYIEGPSLQQVLKQQRKRGDSMPLNVLLRVLLDTLAGLHAAHDLRDGAGNPLNLVHRDVSPHNVLIGVDGIARITDFGVARAEARIASTHSGQLKGKIAYMSPEQARGLAIDRRADIYAAGVMLWEMLTGKPLVRGESDIVMLTVVATGNHRTPREVKPTVPEALSAAAMRALRYDPGDRFATAADFAEAVESAATSSGIGIGTPRAVASFIRELNLHAAPVDLPAPTPSLRGASLGAPMSSRVTPSYPPSSQSGSHPRSSSAVAVPSEASLPTIPSGIAANPLMLGANDQGAAAKPGAPRSWGRLVMGGGALVLAAAVGAMLAINATRPGKGVDLWGRAQAGAVDSSSAALPAAKDVPGVIIEPSSEPLSGSSAPSGSAAAAPAEAPLAEAVAQPPPVNSGVTDAGAADGAAQSAPPPAVTTPRREPFRPVQGGSNGKPNQRKDPVYRPPAL
jgi:serine/threonine-protein kinase